MMMKAQSKLPKWVPFLIAAVLVPSPVLWAQSGSEEPGEGENQARHNRVYRYLAEPMGRGYLGVQVLHLTPELRVHFGVSEDAGVMVAKVDPGSPAAQAEVQVGDILTDIDSESIVSPMMLSRYIRAKEEGVSVNLGLWRDGGARAVFVTVAERERRRVWLGGPPAQPGTPVFERGRPFVWDGQDFVVDLDNGDFTAALDEALGDLEERFDSEEWQERLERIQSMDWKGMAERMKSLEERLKALEQELSQEESN